MAVLSKNDFLIRNYTEADAASIGEFNKVAELSYRYNPDFVPENIFCAVNGKGGILGVGHLEPHDTWHLIGEKDIPPDFVFKLLLRIAVNPDLAGFGDVRAGLLDRLLLRAGEIRKQYPGKKVRVFSWVESDDNDGMDFLLQHGFLALQNILVMKYDLSQEIPSVPAPEGIRLSARALQAEEELLQLHEAEKAGFSGVAWSMNLMRWYMGAPEWYHFSAFTGDRLVGNTMTWMITGERSAIENIFVLPEYRNKGVARFIVTKALSYLKDQGKTIATLSVLGDNRKAIALYTSLGFRMFGLILEIGVDL